jgi:hypothetical protein
MAQPESISFAQLVDWLEDRLASTEAATIARQVEANPLLQAEVAWLRRFLQTSQSVILADPPADLRVQLRERFAARNQAQPGFLRRLVAAFSFDSGLQPLATGVRSATHPPRQLIYTTEIADVVLVLQPHAGDKQLDLVGQILPQGDETPLYSVQLLQDDTEVALTTSDDLGEFIFVALPTGVYQLVLSAEQQEILVPDLSLHLQL